MKVSIALIAAIALMCGGMSASMGADTNELVACQDGTLSQPSSYACANNGGVKAASAQVPIRATKGATPINANSTITKPSRKSVKKTASRASTPTAKCMDGAMYFSRERRGACAKHGGIQTWYGW